MESASLLNWNKKKRKKMQELFDLNASTGPYFLVIQLIDRHLRFQKITILASL